MLTYLLFFVKRLSTKYDDIQHDRFWADNMLIMSIALATKIVAGCQKDDGDDDRVLERWARPQRVCRSGGNEGCSL